MRHIRKKGIGTVMGALILAILMGIIIIMSGVRTAQIGTEAGNQGKCLAAVASVSDGNNHDELLKCSPTHYRVKEDGIYVDGGKTIEFGDKTDENSVQRLIASKMVDCHLTFNHKRALVGVDQCILCSTVTFEEKGLEALQSKTQTQTIGGENQKYLASFDVWRAANTVGHTATVEGDVPELFADAIIPNIGSTDAFNSPHLVVSREVATDTWLGEQYFIIYYTPSGETPDGEHGLPILRSSREDNECGVLLFS